MSRLATLAAVAVNFAAMCWVGEILALRIGGLS
jgi:hypothetical protein